jgi:hypothetical protein
MYFILNSASTKLTIHGIKILIKGDMSKIYKLALDNTYLTKIGVQ